MTFSDFSPPANGGQTGLAYEIRANNSIGYSDYSDYTFIAFGDIPPTPPAIDVT